MKSKPTNNYLNYRNFLVLGAVVLLLLITLASCSNISPPVYTVTFNANGGTIDGEASVQVVGGTAVKEPSDPVRTGYSFDGWYVEGANEVYNFSTPVNSDLTLVAKWTRLNYKVTFNANDGTIDGKESIQSEVVGGTAVKEPSDPIRTGYTFDGWCIEGQSETYDFSTPVNSDLTLVAKWTRLNYKVTFNAKGGTVDGKESIQSEVEEGTAVKEPSDPVRTGYLFDGWCIEGQSETYDFSTPVNSDLTLEAKWTRIYYKVTFKADGGSFSGDDSITVASGDTVSSPASPTKDRYSFDGWYVEGASEAYNFSTPVNSNLTLVAKWTLSECIVTFELDGGSFSEEETVTVDVGKAVSKPSAPTKAEYLFAGWFEEGSNTYYDFNAPVNGDLTLVAMWTDESTLSFALDNTAGGYIVSQETTAAPSGWLAIPDIYKGQPVVAISSNAFSNNLTITAVTIPASVETIGNGAFHNCQSITTVTFESGSKLSEICDGAFSNTAIVSIEIPAGVMDMGYGVFKNCYNLQTIRLGREDIPSGWNNNWKNYCNATVINSKGETIDFYSVTFNINGGTIDGASGLIPVVPEGTTVEEPIDPKKDGYLFAGWFKEGSNTYYDFSTPVNGDLTLVAMWTDESTLSFALDNTAGGYSVSQGTTAPSGLIAIPNTYNGQPVVAIKDEAFSWNINITAVTIPASVETIGNGAFNNCHSITTVTFESGSKLSKIGNSAFYNTAIESIEIPAGVMDMGYGVFNFCYNLQTIKIGTETIPSGWHSGWKSICDATVINSKGETIDYYSVTFNINGGTIDGAFGLLYEVPEGRTVEEPIDPQKDGYLFAGWFVEGSYTYYDFSTPVNGDLTLVAAWTDENTLTFTENTSGSGYIVSQGTNALSGWLAIPDTYNGKPVVAIKDEAFSWNSNITAVTIPASVESLGSRSFFCCTSLRTVMFESGSKLSEINFGAFSNTALESIEIPASVTVIDGSAFEFCTSLSTVTFESGSILSNIVAYAFCMTAITSIEIPATVITMGIEVFNNCNNLQTIKIGTVAIPDTGWNARWKDGCNATVINSKGQTI